MGGVHKTDPVGGFIGFGLFVIVVAILLEDWIAFRVQLRLQCLVHNLLVMARHSRAQKESQGPTRAAG